MICTYSHGRYVYSGNDPMSLKQFDFDNGVKVPLSVRRSSYCFGYKYVCENFGLGPVVSEP